jgi:hypothetical protein
MGNSLPNSPAVGTTEIADRYQRGNVFRAIALQSVGRRPLGRLQFLDHGRVGQHSYRTVENDKV